jgi:hypothetical protein
MEKKIADVKLCPANRYLLGKHGDDAHVYGYRNGVDLVLLRAPNKMSLASLRRLAALLLLSAPARLARDRYAHFVRRSKVFSIRHTAE